MPSSIPALMDGIGCLSWNLYIRSTCSGSKTSDRSLREMPCARQSLLLHLFTAAVWHTVVSSLFVSQCLTALDGMHLPALHPGNFGMAVPEVERFSVVDIWNLTGRPKVQVILHTSHSLGSFPPYLCSKMDLGT